MDNPKPKIKSVLSEAVCLINTIYMLSIYLCHMSMMLSQSDQNSNYIIMQMECIL